jgi:hypothetical protein
MIPGAMETIAIVTEHAFGGFVIVSAMALETFIRMIHFLEPMNVLKP